MFSKILLSALCTLFAQVSTSYCRSENSDREYWVGQLIKMSRPVIKALSEDSLKASIPISRSTKALKSSREFVTHMESVGRTFAGVAPWLELGEDDTPEGKLRGEMILLSQKALANSVNPTSKDFFNSSATRQILVNSAFLIQGIFRAPTQLWKNLDSLTRNRLLEQWRSTRTMVPGNNNWLLFSAMVECALKEFSGEWNEAVVRRAVDSHMEWYKGDGIYGDGKVFHLDYYNSFVIHPMLMQVLEVARKYIPEYEQNLELHKARLIRYAEIQERMIAPDGTYPLIGRSITYRTGAFQVLAMAAQMKILPQSLSEGGVRSALTAVIGKQLDFKGTYDANGWLTVGVCGEQLELGDVYLSSPCLYLASLIFLPLGLPEQDSFWSVSADDWTSVKAFSGKTTPIDKFLKQTKK